VSYYLGIDGGGSKTTCAVGDEKFLLSSAVAGPSNITRVGEARARESLHESIRQACATAKIDPWQLERACIGVAGAGREEIAKVVHKIIAEVIPAEIEVAGDMQIVLEAAFGDGPGVIVIAGTGSIAYGRDSQGRTARAGGWGFTISDEGSAHWIGRAAVTALLRAIDESKSKNAQAADDESAAEALPLLEELKAAWNLHSLDEFLRTANSNPDFAALFPAILDAADTGNALAQRVLAQAADELAQLAGIVVRRLFAEGEGNSLGVPLAMAGGVFRHSVSVREMFCSIVCKLDPLLELNAQIVEPVAGALQMARQSNRRG
jgi:N-acetylglucosamine kinase-like BadF-type ATPase